MKNKQVPESNIRRSHSPRTSRLLDDLRTNFADFDRYLKLTYRDRVFPVFPGITNVSHVHQRLLDALSLAFEDFKSTHDFGFLTGDLVAGTMYHLRQIAGHPFNPQGAIPPAVDYSQGSGLSKEWAQAFRTTIGLMTDGFVSKGVRLNRISKTGIPRLTSDLVVKTAIMRKGIEEFSGVATAALRWLESEGRFSFGSWLIENLDVVPCYLEGRRLQPEKISRENGRFIPRIREVTDWTGNKIQVDRSLNLGDTLNIQAVEDMFRVRSRVVYNPTSLLNYPLQYFATGMQHHFMEKYPIMFHHTKDDLERNLSGYPFLIGVDVTNFDWNQRTELHALMIDSINSVSDHIKAMMWAMLSLPAIIRNDYAGEEGFTLSGDPFEFKPWSNYGSPSGWAFVSPAAKMVGSGLLIGVLQDCGVIGRSDHEVDLTMKGSHPRVRVFDCGDDAMFAFRSEDDYATVREYLVQEKCPVMKLTVEEPISFLGYNFVKAGSGVKALLDIRNFIVKPHVPERGIDSPLRKYYALGFELRKQVYGDHPRFLEFERRWDEVFTKIAGTSLSDLMRQEFRLPDNPELVNVADAVFLDNPQSIYYKLDEDDVSKELLDSMYAYVGPEHFASLHQYVTVPIRSKK